MNRLTGRTRYRETWLCSRLVLQVEVEADYQRHLPAHWRDATAADFLPASHAQLFADPPMPYPGQRPCHGYQPLPCNTPAGPAKPPTER